MIEESEEIPSIENIHSTLYNAVMSDGCVLNMNCWHSCETSHCRAGWAIHLCGDKGYFLEDQAGIEKAAILIYAKSGYSIKTKMFYEESGPALAHMKQLAEAEAAGPDVLAEFIRLEKIKEKEKEVT